MLISPLPEESNIVGMGARLPRLVRVASILLAFFSVGRASLANQNPIVDSLTSSAVALGGGATALLTLEAHDPDCTTPPCTSGCGSYIQGSLTQWRASGGSFLSLNLGANASPYESKAVWRAPTTPGSYAVAATVWDAGGFMCGGRLSGTGSVSICVGSDAPAQVTSMSAAPGSVFAGGAVTLGTTVTDPDGDPVTVVGWSASGGTVAWSPTAPLSAVWTAPATAGAYVVRITVTDGKGCALSAGIPVAAVLAAPTLSLGTFDGPDRVALEPSGRIAVGERAGERVRVFDGAGNALFTVSGRGAATGLAWYGGFLFVAYETPPAVSVFGWRGEEEAHWDASTAGATRLTGLAVDGGSGVLYLLDAGGCRVVGVTADLKFTPVRSFGSCGGGTGQFVGGAGIAVDPTTGRIYVTDAGQAVGLIAPAVDPGTSGGARIQSFDASGNWLDARGSSAQVGPGYFDRVEGPGVGPGGIVYVPDSFQGTVQGVTPDWRSVGYAALYGSGAGQVETPMSAAADPTRLAVASMGTGRVEVYALTASSAAAIAPAEAALPWETPASTIPPVPAEQTVEPPGVGTEVVQNPPQTASVYWGGDRVTVRARPIGRSCGCSGQGETTFETLLLFATVGWLGWVRRRSPRISGRQA